MTGVVSPAARSRRHTSNPSRPGINTSSTTMSGADRATASSAARPSAAMLTVNPA